MVGPLLHRNSIEEDGRQSKLYAEKRGESKGIELRFNSRSDTRTKTKSIEFAYESHLHRPISFAFFFLSCTTGQITSDELTNPKSITLQQPIMIYTACHNPFRPSIGLRPIELMLLHQAWQEQAEKDEVKTEAEKETENDTEQPRTARLSRDMHLTRTDDNLVLTLDLPGVRPENTQVQALEDGVLKITAERNSRTVTRTLQLDADTTDAAHSTVTLEDGVLTVNVPKKERMEPETTTISVHAGYAPQDEAFSLDLPGVKLANVELTLKENVLTLQAERNGNKIRRVLRVHPKKWNVATLQAYLADGVLQLTADAATPFEPVTLAINNEQALKEAEQQEEEHEVAAANDAVFVEAVENEDE